MDGKRPSELSRSRQNSLHHAHPVSTERVHRLGLREYVGLLVKLDA